MRKFVAPILLLLIAVPVVCEGDKGPSSDPDAAMLITSDINNFWKAYDAAFAAGGLKQSRNIVEIFRTEYEERGTPGLKDFFRLRIKDSASLAATVNATRKYYDSIRPNTLRVNEMRPRIRATFYALKYLYPEAVFPDVYFMIGRMSTGGTTSSRGLLIGTELFSRAPNSPDSELNDWHKQVIRPIDYLSGIVAHELIHYQQKYPVQSRVKPTLLAACINEGAADFLGELISGGHSDQHLHAYGTPREKELWEEFKRAMNDTDLHRWLYGGSAIKDRPADLGYFVGYKITEAYYRAARNKRQAIKSILEIQDFQAFLKESGYQGGSGEAR